MRVFLFNGFSYKNIFPKQNMNHWFIYFLFHKDYIWIFISNITNIINVSSVCTLEPHKQFWLIMACQMWVHFKRIGTRVMCVGCRRRSWSKIWDLWPTTKNFQRRYRLIPQTVFQDWFVIDPQTFTLRVKYFAIVNLHWKHRSLPLFAQLLVKFVLEILYPSQVFTISVNHDSVIVFYWVRILLTCAIVTDECLTFVLLWSLSWNHHCGNKRFKT